MMDETKTNDQLIDELKSLRGEVARLKGLDTSANDLGATERLAAGLAHNLNNILTSILGYSHLGLKIQHFDKRTPKYLSEISKAAYRVASITDMLLAFAGRQVRKPELLNLNDVLADLQAPLRGMTGAGVEINTVLASDLRIVKSDPAQIKRVVLNLVENSSKAMPDGTGTLTIESSNVHLNEKYAVAHPGVEAGDYVMLSVKDTGVGMTKEVIACAFEPFYSTKEPWEGAGMGLAVCKGIVTQNGGHIDIESRPDQGTTVRVYLPRSRSLSPSAGDTKPANHESSTRTVLLVEEQPAIMDLASRVLREHGYSVLMASDEQEALEVGRRRNDESIDLIVASLVKPLVNGEKMSKKFKKLHPETRVQHIFSLDKDIVGESVVERFDPILLMRSVHKGLGTRG